MKIAPIASNAAMAVAVGALFIAPYLSRGDSFAKYLLPDLAIAGLFAWRFGSDAIRRVGLAIPPRHVVIAFVTLVIGFFAARAIVDQITTTAGIEILIPRPLFSLSQVLHQEIVMRAILLGALCAWFKSSTVLAAVAAAFFAATHPLLFWWIEGVMLPPFAVMTLFAFGLATNLLFLRAGHIAFSFSAHAAWNLARFGTGYLVLDLGLISEAESFVAIEGSGLALGSATILVVAVVLAQYLLDRRA